MSYPTHAGIGTRLADVEEELSRVVAFWAERAPDRDFGGYLTGFDGRGHSDGATDKFIVTQARMIWFFSACIRAGIPGYDFMSLAREGADFFIERFWDDVNAGWHWCTNREGIPQDTGKVVYGQSFALYALSECALATRDQRAFDYACRTFDVLQSRAVDVRFGGYLENFTPDWQPEASGKAGGDRKSLDVHMHLLEALTTLVELTGTEYHRRRLEEIIGLILDRLIDRDCHCGRNHVRLNWEPIPAIPLARTWNADRTEDTGSTADTTSYGHNLELVWLTLKAADILGRRRSEFSEILQPIVEHAVRFGLDSEFGGIYRDGPHNGPAAVWDKEWWQQAESLVGFLNSYELFKDARYWDAFENVRSFVWNHMIAAETGEWYPLCSREGKALWSEAGHAWKAAYHTGRAMLECRAGLKRLLDTA